MCVCREKDTGICILQGNLWADVATSMTLNVTANSLLATFTEASKMAKRNQDKTLNCAVWEKT